MPVVFSIPKFSTTEGAFQFWGKGTECPNALGKRDTEALL